MAAPREPAALDADGSVAPQFAVSWDGRFSSLRESYHVLFSGPRSPKEFIGVRYFKNCWVKTAAPRRQFGTSIVWHIVAVVLLIQFGSILLGSHRASAMSDFDLTWSGPVNDLPLIAPAIHTKKATAHPAKPPGPTGADAFHPRQTIISAPRAPNHPRQTLIRPDAPQLPPKILPELPNIVEVANVPARPQQRIATEQLLQQPKMTQRNSAASVATPDLPNQEKNLADINIASEVELHLARPTLALASGATIAAPKHTAAATTSAGPAPEISGGTGNQTLIALSANPAPALPAAPIPAGNVAANVSISPDGGRSGTGGSGAGGSGSGGGHGAVVPGISITGGNPKGVRGVSGLGGTSAGSSGAMHAMPGQPGAKNSASASAPAVDPGKIPIAERLKSGAPPEHIFGDRKIYTMNVNNPNVTSSSGSWILKFAELDESSGSLDAAKPAHAGALSGPIAERKVDPRYPESLMRAHVEGEVVLYAIIRADGSVDSIQVARSLDKELDQYAMEALAQWKFKPATRDGVPVALEAIIHIPFKARPGD
jgi:TonB family protein